MTFDYSIGSRTLQDRYDSRRLADRLAEVKVHDRFTADDQTFIERQDMFFLATAGLFGDSGGSEWAVSHYRLSPT